MNEKIVYLPILIESNDDGYLAKCPDIQGVFAEGESIEEAIFNCVDVAKMIAQYRLERKETVGFYELDYSPEIKFSVMIPVGLKPCLV